MRGISQQWGKDLDVVSTSRESEEIESKANPQDMATYDYLQSLANFLANERITLEGFRNQLEMNVKKACEKMFKKQNDEASRAYQAVNEFRQDFGARANSKLSIED